MDWYNYDGMFRSQYVVCDVAVQKHDSYMVCDSAIQMHDMWCDDAAVQKHDSYMACDGLQSISIV